MKKKIIINVTQIHTHKNRVSFLRFLVLAAVCVFFFLCDANPSDYQAQNLGHIEFVVNRIILGR